MACSAMYISKKRSGYAFLEGFGEVSGDFGVQHIDGAAGDKDGFRASPYAAWSPRRAYFILREANQCGSVGISIAFFRASDRHYRSDFETPVPRGLDFLVRFRALPVRRVPERNETPCPLSVGEEYQDDPPSSASGISRIDFRSGRGRDDNAFQPNASSGPVSVHVCAQCGSRPLTEFVDVHNRDGDLFSVMGRRRFQGFVVEPSASPIAEQHPDFVGKPLDILSRHRVPPRWEPLPQRTGRGIH